MLQTYIDDALPNAKYGQQQTRNHIAGMCQLRKSEVGLQVLHKLEGNEYKRQLQHSKNEDEIPTMEMKFDKIKRKPQKAIYRKRFIGFLYNKSLDDVS